jgi:hypothetical protein
MDLISRLQKKLGVFSLERDRPAYKITEGDLLREKKLDMTAKLRQQVRFFYELEANVIEAASDAGVTINPQDRNTRELAIETQGEENYSETPPMFFEDILDALEVARTNLSYGSRVQYTTAKEAAVTVSESIEILRHIHHLSPLTKLEQVATALSGRVRELEKECAKPRTPG